MSYQGISTGTSPNDGTGDTLIDGAVKVNRNFQEIYSALGDGSNINIIPSGSRILFQQTSAPTGWTKDTTNVDNRALRVVSGTAGSGGTNSFTSVFASNRSVPLPLHNHGITEPNGGQGHSHGITEPNDGQGHNHTATQSFGSRTSIIGGTASDNIGGTAGNFAYTPPVMNYSTTGISINRSTTGISINNEGTADATMDFAVQYIDVIIAQRN